MWLQSRLWFWAEDGDAGRGVTARSPVDFKNLRSRRHPFACDVATLMAVAGVEAKADELTVGLPSTAIGPLASPQLQLVDQKRPPSRTHKTRLFPWKVHSISLDAAAGIDWLLTAGAGTSVGADSGSSVSGVGVELRLGDSLRFFGVVVAFGLELVARGRVLPALVETADGYDARWRPVITGDEATRLDQLTSSMPPSCRSEWGALRRDPGGVGGIVRDLVETVVDVTARAASPAIAPRSGRGRSTGALAMWLDALSSGEAAVQLPESQLEKLSVALDEWRASARSASRELRLSFRLVPPADDVAERDPQARWSLEVLLQSVRDPSLLVGAERIWSGDELDDLLADDVAAPQEVLLRDLGRASRLYPELERLLDDAQPDTLVLDTIGAAGFLAEAAPVLGQAGFGVFLPSWWGTKRARLGARLKAKSKSAPRSTSSGLLGLAGLVDYRWEIALGDDKIAVSELERLVALKTPLVRVRGEWVHLNETDLAAALAIARGQDRKRDQRDGMTVGDALRVGLGLDDSGIGLPVVGIQADGWLGDLLEAGDHRVEEAVNPPGFGAELRPYQLRGLAWLDFHHRLGLGACLADDMGLGKTAQLLALVAAQRTGESAAQRPGRQLRAQREKPKSNSDGGPTLVVCPMSVVGNWQREATRFAPDLVVHVHHGADRISGEEFVEAASGADLVLTTYQLATRDQALLESVKWHRIVLDEAQNIKNADARQAKAVRALPSTHRIALTGTPVENRLSELWSIMEFLNPGLLGSATAFRKRFSHPIERDQDNDAAERLKRLTGPFVLRRLKTDRSIITDLPEKLEIKAYCNLTREQGSLYQAVVDDMLARIEEAEGIARKGLVLSTMLRLKQVCNHPAQFLSDGSRLAGRSGKLERLEEITDEVLADGERLLVFTQFAEMGMMLREHLQARLNTDVAWLHGGITKKARDAMVERFQNGDGPSVFLLSLKAGGTGLTLTAANHVVHFDRWWNPAVENQATDRAFRIGQHRNVQVRKFVTVGTLEERIDQMIEQKAALADRIVGAGEGWITELSTEALRDVIALGADAVGEDGAS